MLTLVLGGAASGKSAYAETIAMETHHAAGGRLWYIATMQKNASDPESSARIQRHRKARKGKGFCTLELPTDPGRLPGTAAPGDTLLIEDLTNLLANRLYAKDPSGAEAKTGVEIGASGTAKELMRLSEKGYRLVIVGNLLSLDGIDYAPETMRFLSLLQSQQQMLTAYADYVWEVCCGIPICLKRPGTPS